MARRTSPRRSVRPHRSPPARLVLATLLLVPATALLLPPPTAALASPPPHTRSVAPERTPLPDEGATHAVDLSDSDRGARTLADHLRHAPGVHLRSAGGPGSPTFLSLRGSAPDQVRILLDGIPLHDGAEGAFDIHRIPIDLLGGATLYRSTPPLAWGAPLPGGALNLHPPALGGPRARASLSGGSFLTRKASVSTSNGDPLAAGGATLLALTYQGSRGDFRFHDDNGTPFDPEDAEPNRRRINNRFDEAGALLYHRRPLGEWQGSTLALATWRQAGVPGLQTLQAEQTRLDSGRADLHLRLHRSRWPAPPLDSTWLAGLSLGTERYRDPEGELGVGRQDRRALHTRALLRALHTLWLHESSALHATLDGSHEHLATRERLGGTDAPDARRLQTGTALELETRALSEHLRLRGGARIDYLHTRRLDGRSQAQAGSEEERRNGENAQSLPPESGSPDGQNPQGGSREGATAAGNGDAFLISPAATLAFVPPALAQDRLSLQLWTGVSRAARAPGFGELFGDRGTRLGNPALRPEVRRGGDVGVGARWQAAAIRLGVGYTFFDRRVRDLITWLQNSQGVQRPQNIGRAALRGHEFEAEVALHDVLGVRATYTQLDALDRSGLPDFQNRRIPWQPRHAGSLELWGRLGPIHGSWEMRGHDEVPTDRENSRYQPARLEHDASLRAALGRGFALDLLGRNLADRRSAETSFRRGGEDVQVTQAVADYLGYPLPGRAFYLTLSWVAP